MKRGFGKEETAEASSKRQKTAGLSFYSFLQQQQQQPPSTEVEDGRPGETLLTLWQQFFDPKATEAGVQKFLEKSVSTTTHAAIDMRCCQGKWAVCVCDATTWIKLLCFGIRCATGPERQHFETVFVADGPSAIQRTCCKLSPGLGWQGLMKLMQQLYEHLSYVPVSAEHNRHLVSLLDFDRDRWAMFTLFPHWFRTRNMEAIPESQDFLFYAVYPMFPNSSVDSPYRILYQDNYNQRWICLLGAWQLLSSQARISYSPSSNFVSHFVRTQPSATDASLAELIHIWSDIDTKQGIKMRRLQSTGPWATRTKDDPTLLRFGDPGPWAMCTDRRSVFDKVMELATTAKTLSSPHWRNAVDYLDANKPMPVVAGEELPVVVKPEPVVPKSKRELFASHMKRSPPGLRLMPETLALVPSASRYYPNKNPTIEPHTKKQLMAYLKRGEDTFSHKTKLETIDDPKYEPAALRGQLGVRCVVDLNEGDIIGEYKGFYRPATNEGPSRYVFTFELNGIAYEIDGDPSGKDNDGVPNSLCIVTRVNDYRRDVQTVAQGGYTYKNNAMNINCQFINALYNGEPFVFMIAICNISAGSPLQTDYGETYWRSIIGSCSSTPLVLT